MLFSTNNPNFANSNELMYGNYMKTQTKKVFAAPRVLQTVEVILEYDFLQGASNVSRVEATGHELEQYKTESHYGSGDWSID